MKKSNYRFRKTKIQKLKKKQTNKQTNKPTNKNQNKMVRLQTKWQKKMKKKRSKEKSNMCTTELLHKFQSLVTKKHQSLNSYYHFLKKISSPFVTNRFQVNLPTEQWL